MPDESPRRSDLYEGTIGWAEDGGNFADLGDGTEPALVNVTLYSGRDRSQPLRSDVAQGTRIRCRVMGPLYYVPPSGARVMVAIPGDQFSIPGAGVIMGRTDAAPSSQFAKDRVVLDFGPKIHVVIRGKSVSMQDEPGTPNVPRCFIGVGTPYSGGTRGVYAINEQGSGVSLVAKVAAMYAADAGTVKSTCNLTPTEADLVCNDVGVSGVQAKGGDVSTMGANNNVVGGKVYLGQPALITTAAVNGVAISSVGPANVISATVLASP